MTKWELMSALMAGGTVKVSLKGNVGIVQAVERESGDGRSFNVRMCFDDNTVRTVHVRTDD
jgi:hypothetical protein